MYDFRTIIFYVQYVAAAVERHIVVALQVGTPIAFATLEWHRIAAVQIATTYFQTKCSFRLCVLAIHYNIIGTNWRIFQDNTFIIGVGIAGCTFCQAGKFATIIGEQEQVKVHSWSKNFESNLQVTGALLFNHIHAIRAVERIAGTAGILDNIVARSDRSFVRQEVATLNGSSLRTPGRSTTTASGSIIDYTSSFGAAGIGISYTVTTTNGIIIEWANSIGVHLPGVYTGAFASSLGINGNTGCLGHTSIGVSNTVTTTNGLVSSRARSGNGSSSWVERGSTAGDHILRIVAIAGGAWPGAGALYTGSFSSTLVGVSDIITATNGLVYGGAVLRRVNLPGVYTAIIKTSTRRVIINTRSFRKTGIEVGNSVATANRAYRIGASAPTAS